MKPSVRARLRRHPVPVVAFFRHSLVLTYALPQEVLRPLLPAGLELDSHGEFGFLAIAMVQTEQLRPVFVPRLLGQNFFLCGYRIFTRFTTRAGRRLRGLRILRSYTDRRLMVLFGNLLTHYRYRLAEVRTRSDENELEVQVCTREGEADLLVRANLAGTEATLPTRSPFADWHQARLFAGPLPFTFDFESETDSIILIEGVRKNWQPRPVAVEVLRNSFFEQPEFRGTVPQLASAFYVQDIPYRWRRGVVESLAQSG